MPRKVSKCASCAASMVWLKTRTGKNMPADAATVADDDIEFDPARHTSHFATCPDAKRFRRK